MTQQCTSPQCSRVQGHDGPHGYEVQAGLVLAPYSDAPRTRPDTGSEVPIPCNSCGKDLKLDLERCRAACECGQSIAFDADLSWTQTILPKLYPAKMTDSRMLKEFGEHTANEYRFADRLRLRFGLITEEQYAERSRDIDRELQRFLDEEIPQKHWWQFWRSS